MVTLPVQFVATKYPGYFWNTRTHVLYSIKIDGILKPLKKRWPSKWNKINGPGYYISHKGERKFMPHSELIELKLTSHSEIPMR